MNLFAFNDDELLRLADQHGTPCFVYRGESVAAQYQTLVGMLPSRARVAYAVKANPFPDLLRKLEAMGAGFDCASQGELERVAALQPGPGRVFFAGPGKREQELALALRLGVRVQAEGWEDLARLESLAEGPLEVNLRVHPAGGVEESNRIIGGVGPSAFGVDEEAVPELLTRARSLHRVRIRGLHVFAASNQREAARLLATHAMVFELGRELHLRHGLDLQQIDVGGGLGVPYAAGQTVLDVEALGDGLARLLAEHSWFRGELILEPGRFIAAHCGVYLARVVRVKASRGETFAILEGGINHLLRPLLTGEAFPVRKVGGGGPTAPCTLAGPLCTSLDRVGRVELPALEPGDLLAFGMAGAYGYSEGMTHFLSHPEPKEIWVD
jgi:diaminopimelate decarboxylase